AAASLPKQQQHLQGAPGREGSVSRASGDSFLYGDFEEGSKRRLPTALVKDLLSFEMKEANEKWGFSEIFCWTF
ncbi:hypothetical protein ETH_00025435, partial [Eimeria tenella]